MPRNDKLFRDRKILRKIDLNLAQQSRFLVAGNILVFLFVAIEGGLYESHTAPVLAMGGMLLVLSIAGFYQSVRFDALYGAGPAHWRRGFIGLMLGIALLMGLFTAMVIWFEEFSVNTFLLSLYLVGYAALNSVEWSPYHRQNLVRHLLLLVPVILAYVAVLSISGLTIAAGLLLLLVLQIRKSELMYTRHWDNVSTHHELHIKARDLANAVNEANSASRVKTEFLGNITQEIRTPMNNVLGMLALLDDTNLTPQQQELQKIAVRSGEGLLGLIDDIRDFSRIASGQIKLEQNIFNLRRCVDQTLELLGPRAHEKGLELSCVYASNLPVRVKGDPERLAQLISNLVSNAIKYSAGTDIQVSVQMPQVSDTECELKVEVRDNGKGIDPALQEHLFEAFSKKSTTHQYAEAATTGLGLAISKGLAQRMQGEIGFSSQPDVGTLFWFTAHLKLSTQQAQKPTLIKELMDLRAMLVDVDGGLRDALVAELSGWNTQTTFASSENEVADSLLAAFRDEKSYDVIIINQPPTQAANLDLPRHLQSFPELAGLHVLMLSSLAQRADAVRLNDEEAMTVEWLSKPVTQEKLSRALAQSFHLDTAAILPEQTAREKTGVRSVLLVEDNAVSQMVARSLLFKLGYGVTVAANGKEALGRMQEREFDLVLMDCIMPVLDGYEATRSWREIEAKQGGHVPIIAMTASLQEGERQRCLAVGMDDFISKPVNLEELHAKLRQWLVTGEATETKTANGTSATSTLMM